MSPRTEAIAYRIWAFADPRGWDVTVADIAAALDLRNTSVQSICTVRRWHGRMRGTAVIGRENAGRFTARGMVDHGFDEGMG